ncbi:hypothetical protein WJX81_008187 [Elliptochloris bilobata]|uniref:DNA polymerase n=1 Tax=Elliptochloris bilobata TaxID=381761 RepID=A0AAW1S6H6_9CHLO
MEDGGRSRRAARPPSKAAGALAQLAELRRTGVKRVSAYEFKEEEPVFDVVAEDEYADIVAKRRGDAGDFIEDDDGKGYADSEEEEDDWESGAQRAAPAAAAAGSKKRKGSAGGSKGDVDAPAKKKALPAASRAARQSINKLFSAAAARPAASVKTDAATAEASDALLDDILGDLTPAARPLVPTRGVTLAGRAPGRAGIAAGGGNPFARAGAWQSAAVRRPHCLSGVDLDVAGSDGNAMDYVEGGDSRTQDPGPPCEPDPTLGPAPAATHTPAPATAHAEEPDQAPASEAAAELASNAHAATQGAEATPAVAGAAGSAPSAAKTPWRTPPPVFDEAETPAAASGWQELCGADEDGEGAGEEAAGAAVADGKEWVDDGSLPVDGGGALPFFFLDAHEEPATPDRLFLFGKVEHEGQHRSCCAMVKGLQRSVFFVPAPGVFGGEELAHLEAAAAAADVGDAGARGDLLRHLHALAAELKAEVRAALAKYGVARFVIKPVRRSYAFERPGVLHGQQWVLKVRYPASAPALPLDLSGQHFVAVFGAQQSPLEALLLKRRIMGPSWLSLAQPVRIDAGIQVSWCKLEVELASPKAVSAGAAELAKRDPPPLVVAALNLKTVLQAKAATNEVVAASVMCLPAAHLDRPMAAGRGAALRHFSTVRKLDGLPYPAGFMDKVKEANRSALGVRNGGAMLSAQAGERALLAHLLARLQELDPDVLVGHNIAAFDLDVLLHRLQHHKVPNWSRIGRLKRSKLPSLAGGGHTFGGGAGAGLLSATAGRLLCDTYLGARELLREVDYTMRTLAAKHLGAVRSELAAADVPGKFEDAGALLGLVAHTETDAWLALNLASFLNLLALSRQLSCLSGSLWSRTLQGQRAQRIEMLLLHEFHRRKFLLPDKLGAREREHQARRAHVDEHGDDQDFEAARPGRKRNKTPAYAGGLVLEPKKGLYDRFVLLLDFNSLYPSIIQEYNICFTTVRHPDDGGIAPLPEPSQDMAILPKVIHGLVQQRREAKALLKGERNALRRTQLDIRQQALKLTANSMYGCLGFAASRFFAQPLAELVTAQGREILQSTVDLVQGTVGLEVIYGDTDSIMIATGSTDVTEVVALGARVKREVNKRYKLLELEVDGIFRSMLLLKKKKYAAIKLERDAAGAMREVREAKGLDMVRRDWSLLSKDCGNFALDAILSGRPREDVVDSIHAKLQEVREKLAAGAVPLGNFVITKQLTRRPEEYPDAKSQPHVQVALRRKAQNRRDGTLPGETVPYIICMEIGEDGSPTGGGGSKGLAERAYHPDEVRSNARLAVDNEYYLAHQVHPVVSRLCAPIEGTDAARLADCLGLDAARFHAVAAAGAGARLAAEDALLGAVASLDDDARYRHCEPLWLKAPNGTRFKFLGAREVAKGTVAAEAALAPPDAVGEALSAVQLANQVRLRARAAVARYYDGALASDDELAPATTRDICLRCQGDTVPGTLPADAASGARMAPLVTEAALYTQLAHFARLLDADAALARVRNEAEREAASRRLAPVRGALAAGLAEAEDLKSRCAFRWVSLEALCAGAAVVAG